MTTITIKEYNESVARRLLSVPFWRAEYFPEFFSENFTMDFPSAPPGMPTHFSVWESERCFEWLNRTVKHWEAELEEFYTTPDPNQFWAIGICRGRVFWNAQDGEFRSKFFVRVQFQDAKIVYMKGWMDTLAFLRAAHIPYDTIIKHFEDPKVDEFLAGPPKRFQQDKKDECTHEDPYRGVDMHPKAIQKRLRDNLQQNVCGVEREKYRKTETFHPDYKRGAWFIPDEQPWKEVDDLDLSVYRSTDLEASVPKEVKPRIFAWVKGSSPWMYRDTRGVNYPTDDPYVYFAEMHSNGPSTWIGNGCEEGHYHQEYLMYMKFDEAGRELIRDEIICPMNKLISARIQVPSFPYYY